MAEQKNYQKEINEKAEQELDDLFNELEHGDMTERKQRQLFNKWYKLVRQGSSLIYAKSRARTKEVLETRERDGKEIKVHAPEYSGSDLIVQAIELTDKLRSLLPPSEEYDE